MVLELVCSSSAAFVDHLNDIRGIDGVESVEALPYLEITKQTYDWGVG